jgi:transcriptional regulator with XRE-family HTH domain
MTKARALPPPPVAHALATLGADLRQARLRRRVPAAYVAERALISRSTLHKVERGDPAVGLGIYARVLSGYGMLERLQHLADGRWDRAGLALEAGGLPRRIRRVHPPSGDAGPAAI